MCGHRCKLICIFQFLWTWLIQAEFRIGAICFIKTLPRGETHRSRPQNTLKKKESLSLPLSLYINKAFISQLKAIHQSMAAEREMNSYPHSFCSVTAMVRVMFDWISLGRNRLQWFQLSAVCVNPGATVQCVTQDRFCILGTKRSFFRDDMRETKSFTDKYHPDEKRKRIVP